MDEPTATIRDRLAILLPRLRRFARAVAGDPHDADDLVQITIERALARAGQWQPDQALEGWVFGILRNAWIDEQRSRGRRRRVFAPEAAGAAVGDLSLERQLTRMSVQSALAQLPEEQRLAVALVLVEGLSYAEAARAMAVPVGTLTSRLARGRRSLQDRLGDEEGVMAT